MDDPDYLHRNQDRHGNVRIYVRRGGKYIRIREEEGTVAFHKAYVAAVEQLAPSAPVTVPVITPHAKGTFGWLVALFFQGSGDEEFLSLDAGSQKRRRSNLEECLQIPLSDDNPKPMGDCPIEHLSAPKMKRMIDIRPEGRPNRRKHLSAFCSWAVENHHIPANFVRDIKAGRRKKTGGYYTWIVPDVQQFLDYHRAQNTRRSRKAVLALGLLLFAGSRRQDMIRLGKQHCRGDWLRYIPKKTIKVRPHASQKPLLPILRDIITECEDVLGDLTFLVTEHNRPFSEAGIGNWFRDRCDEAGLPQCTAHGLKKAGATLAAENGATTRQLMAMFDWDSPDMAEVYTRQAEQKRLAGEAMCLITLDTRSA
jgi:integrase